MKADYARAMRLARDQALHAEGRESTAVERLLRENERYLQTAREYVEITEAAAH